MKLTENFTIEELTFSETAVRKGLNNAPDDLQLESLLNLCTNVLEPLREAVGPIKINSAYRSPEVNKSIGGVPTSQHCKGEAADTVALNLTVKEYFNKIRELVNEGKLVVDQCILEFDSWVHISYRQANRNQFLIAYKEDGKTKYKSAL